MRWQKSAFSFFLTLALILPAANVAADGCVVLLHGLWRSDGSMNKMERLLEDSGFQVRNIGYDSTGETVEALAEETIPRALEACADLEPVHFVTHSMGGILIRQYLEHAEIELLGRVVMLGPPNQGSEVVDAYDQYSAFEWFGGPAGLQLGTGEASIPRSLGPATFDVGIIAGTRSINPILSAILPDRDDGKVTVESTRVDGMNDHLELPVNHVFMMRDPEVIAQVVHYLDHGSFFRGVN